MKLYFNGVQQGPDVAHTGGVFPGNFDLAIGGTVGGGSPGQTIAPYPGFIDEVSIYNRALSPTEIQGIYDAGRGGKFLDTDGDGLPDDWEQLHFGNLNQTAAGDPDGDGFSNLYEWQNGTNPTVSDKPTVSVSANDATASEPGTDTGQFTITRSGSTAANLTVHFQMQGTAVNGTDYTINFPNPVNIPTGSASKTITLTPIDNAAINGPRTAILSLNDNAAYTVGTRTAVVTVSDNEKATVSAAVSDEIIYENGNVSGHITLTRTGSTGYTLPVNFTVSGAINGTDFVALTSPATIPIGSSSVTLNITPIDNVTVNLERVVTLTIAAGTDYIVSGTDPSGSVLILDNELPAVTVTATDANAQEPSNNGTFQVSRSQNLSQAVTVFYKLTGTGGNGIDFQTLSGQVDFAVGQTTADIQVQPLDNTRFDGTRDIVLTILPGADYVDGTPGSATVVLADNEAQPVRVFASADQAKEGTAPVPGVFKFVREGSTRAAIALSFTLTGGAANGVDYQTLTSPATIPADSREVTLNVVPLNDAVPKGNRNVVLTLNANSGYAIIPTRGTATVKIVDDDLPTVSVTAQDAIASETSPNKGTFRFARPATATSEDLTVFYELFYSDPQRPNDQKFVSALTDQTVIPTGQTFVDVDIVPQDDTAPEYTQTVTARIMGSAEYLIGNNYLATISILDNEPLSYSWDRTRPLGVTWVNANLGLPAQTGIPGEIVVRRVGLLPTTAITLSTGFQGGSEPINKKLAFEGDVLTLIEGVSPAPNPTISFPAGANELQIRVGRHIVGGSSPQPNGNVWIYLPSLFGASLGQQIIFKSPGNVFSVSKLADQVAENGAANLFKISRSVDGATTFYVNYIVSGAAAPGSDHSLLQGGWVTFNQTDRYKDISVSALSDAQNYEGWENIRFALDPQDPDTVLGSQTEAEAFIRDASQPANAVPPVDTDRDGLTDAFESANLLNPNVPDAPGTDTDRDGASDIDEQLFGMNPRTTDSTGDGVTDGAEVSMKRGQIADADTVRIKFAAASCVLCHQTTLKAGPYQVTSKQPTFISNYTFPSSAGSDSS